jgi:ADP-heptose:LPS heptosyltransferase
VLAIHPGALGDVLLAVPALRALRRRLPGGAQLTLAAQPRVAELLVALGIVDCGIPFDTLGLDALFVDEPLPPRTQALQRWTRCVCWFAASDGAFTRRLRALVPDTVVASPAGGAGPVWAHLLATVGAAAEEGRESLTIPGAFGAAGLRALAAAGIDPASPLLVVHPGAGGRSKCWPGPGFAAVVESIRRAGFAAVLHQGPATPDVEMVRQVLSALGESVPVLRDPTLPELAGVLARAIGYVGNDSGVSHLACALGTRSVVLFTRLHTRWYPWAPGARTITVATERVDAGDLAEVMRGAAGLLA